MPKPGSVFGDRSQRRHVTMTRGLTLSWTDRKSTRLNSSHSQISYAVFCLKKKTSALVPRHGGDNSGTFGQAKGTKTKYAAVKTSHPETTFIRPQHSITIMRLTWSD